jgi:hypothetical protein
MKKLVRFAVTFSMLTALGLGLAALVATPTRAADDYPCDPTYNMLKSCKAQHGHWDNSCCCCKTH